MWRSICADVHKVNVWHHHVQCQAWTSVLRALALSTRSSVFSEVYECMNEKVSNVLIFLGFFFFFFCNPVFKNHFGMVCQYDLSN